MHHNTLSANPRLTPTGPTTVATTCTPTGWPTDLAGDPAPIGMWDDEDGELHGDASCNRHTGTPAPNSVLQQPTAVIDRWNDLCSACLEYSPPRRKLRDAKQIGSLKHLADTINSLLDTNTDNLPAVLASVHLWAAIRRLRHLEGRYGHDRSNLVADVRADISRTLASAAAAVTNNHTLHRRMTNTTAAAAYVDGLEGGLSYVHLAADAAEPAAQAWVQAIETGTDPIPEVAAVLTSAGGDPHRGHQLTKFWNEQVADWHDRTTGQPPQVIAGQLLYGIEHDPMLARLLAAALLYDPHRTCRVLLERRHQLPVLAVDPTCGPAALLVDHPTRMVWRNAEDLPDHTNLSGLLDITQTLLDDRDTDDDAEVSSRIITKKLEQFDDLLHLAATTLS